MTGKKGRIFALLLSLALMMPVTTSNGVAVAQASTPVFAEAKKELVGIGETYTLAINQKIAGSTYKWSSSNTKIVKVDSKGTVTAVGPGTATIKCKITYNKTKTKTISSKITVVVPATEVKINNASEKNGAHIIQLGDSYDFNRNIVPKNSTDKTYWSIAGGDKDAIRIDNDKNGKITATKVGKVILKATAVKSFTNANIKKSIVNDAVIIEVVGPSATVNSAEIIDSTEIKVVFDSAVERSTLIDSTGKLMNSIELTMRKNVKGVLANDPGKLTAELSNDRKTLTIKTEKMMSGDYGINFTSKIKTLSGIAIEEYYKQISYTDNIPPAIKEITIDDTGMISTILFTEAIDFKNLKVSNTTVASGGGAVDATTLAILNNRLNYIASEDQRSLTINLSKIASKDYGKNFSVTLSGIEDLAGNAPASYTLTAYLYTDASQKPQPRLLYVTRTAYNTITANFDRSVQYGGHAQVGNGSIILGVVDSQDAKKVHYTLFESDAVLVGPQTVKVGYWFGYNAIPSDSSNNQMHSQTVNFTTDQTSPVLMGYEFDAKSNILTLTYNEDVVLHSNTGIFSSTLITVTDEIRSGTNISYAKVDSTDKKIVKLLLSNISLSGSYTFTVDQGFAKDNFRNGSLSRSITISNAGSTNLDLPAPYLITQSSTNLSQINISFAQMIDVVSASNVSNYSIAGVTILSAVVTNNTKDNGATVMLTVADESIDITLERPITIRGVKGYNGSYAAIENYTTMVELKDNKKPKLLEVAKYDRNNPTTLKLMFDEAIQGTMRVKVTQVNSQLNVSYEISNTVQVEGNAVIINLTSIPMTNSYLRIEVLENKITDKSGNQSAPISTQLGVAASY